MVNIGHPGQQVSEKVVLLDLYILVSKNEKDTIRLYINPSEKDIINIPVGLQFVKE